MSDWQEYRWAFDPGKRDEACFTLWHWACDQWHCELRAYAMTAMRLNDAFQAEADLTAEREALLVAEEALAFERKVSENLLRASLSCLGSRDCDWYFMDADPERDATCLTCRANARQRAEAAAREALRSEGSDTASE